MTEMVLRFSGLTGEEIDAEFVKHNILDTKERVRCLNAYIGAVDDTDTVDAIGQIDLAGLYELTKDIVVSGAWKFAR